MYMYTFENIFVYVCSLRALHLPMFMHVNVRVYRWRYRVFCMLKCPWIILYTCMYVYIYVYIYKNAHFDVYRYIHEYIFICIHHLSVCVHACKCMNICMSVYVCTHQLMHISL